MDTKGTAVIHGAQSSTQRSRLLEIPAEILKDIIEYDSLSSLSKTCTTLRHLTTPKLFPETLKLCILDPSCDWRNLHHHFVYPAKGCAQGYLDDRKSERILNAPEGLKHVKQFIVVDTARDHRDGVCTKIKHHGIKRPDEVILAMILRKLGGVAGGLRAVVIPRNIPLRMFVAILHSIPNLHTLEAGIEPRAFHRESRNTIPYQSLLTTVTSLNLERLKFNFADTNIIRGIFLTIERCSTTLRSLEIAATFYEAVEFDGLENSGDEGPDYQRPKLKFLSLEKLRIEMDADSMFANWLLHLSTDFQRLSSLVLHAGKDTQDLTEYILDNGAPLHSLQLTQPPEKVDWTNMNSEKKKKNRLLERLNHLHTLQLSSFGGWDLETVYSHRYTLKRLWLNCHQVHKLLPGQTCPVGERLVGEGLERYPFTIENWPVLEELAVPWFGVDKLPLHLGLRVLRLEHLHTKSTPQETYKTLLLPYITKLAVHTAPAKPNLEIIVVMPNANDSPREEPEATYLCMDYSKEEGVEVEVTWYMSSAMQKTRWSYLFQERAVGRVWDDGGKGGVGVFMMIVIRSCSLFRDCGDIEWSVVVEAQNFVMN
ncbi:uncharacterized protein DFL_001330 [Arthrobotrys flagrans]|uniref:F-box domain-containing protein n=1 Tax=Arthrobotrys flagrans TaxID=97331 RepID=A0A437AGW7_ARTFL|nr:hypothetical protein DFL_001330 [Arthrobotrys flagrans]